MYHKEDLAKLKKMEGLAPEVMKAFWAFDKAAVADGAIPVKYKELIAVAVALTTQCPYCIAIHSDNARKVPPMRSWSRPRWSPLPCEPERPSRTRPTLCQTNPRQVRSWRKRPNKSLAFD